VNTAPSLRACRVSCTGCGRGGRAHTRQLHWQHRASRNTPHNARSCVSHTHTLSSRNRHTRPAPSQEWKCLFDTLPKEWMESVQLVLDYFCERTPRRCGAEGMAAARVFIVHSPVSARSPAAHVASFPAVHLHAPVTRKRSSALTLAHARLPPPSQAANTPLATHPAAALWRYVTRAWCGTTSTPTWSLGGCRHATCCRCASARRGMRVQGGGGCARVSTVTGVHPCDATWRVATQMHAPTPTLARTHALTLAAQ
jgi:hypothetical protein